VDNKLSRPRRVAVVTGAGRGLGPAVAAVLADRGLDVVLTARRLADAEREAGRLDGLKVQAMRLADASASQHTDSRARVMSAELDVTDTVSVSQLFTAVEVRLGRLDVLVNNAAIAIDKDGLPSRPDFEAISATFDTNVFGTMRCCAKAVPLMRGRSYGRITNIASHMASTELTNGPGSPAYSMSKGAVVKYTRLLAAETHGEGILVNAASPGRVETRMNFGNPRYTPTQAAERLVWLSLLEADGPTGQFFSGRDSIPW
jgi:NAD(P)-dependent dehydrogenase (short-subunit alcohol dehydrogenase family)